MSDIKRTPARVKAEVFAKLLQGEFPDYDYLREIFRCLRKELNVAVMHKQKEAPYVPTEAEIKKYYEAVWKSRKMKHVVLIKTLLYTGIRVSELIHVKIADVDFDRCQIRVAGLRGKQDRIVPFPNSFTEILAMHAETIKKRKGEYLFESTWRKPYTDRGVRKILTRYAEAAGITNSLSPKRLRYFLVNWFKKQGLEEAFIKPYTGYETDQSIEKYEKISVNEAKNIYKNAIGRFPI
jgi:integrase/recombinase XerD